MAIVLTEARVREMRDLYRKGLSCPVIAARFDLDSRTVRDAIWGTTWADVPGAVGKGERRPPGNKKGVPFNTAIGERHGLSKLTDETVVLCRRLYREGKTGMAIAKELGLSDTTVYAAIKGLSWSHIPGAVDIAELQQTRKDAAPPKPKRKRGDATRGTLNAKAKLTDEAVAQARDLYRKGDSAEVLAKRFGVKSSTMHTALSGETWGHVPGAIAPSEMHPSGRRRALDNASVAKARTLYRKGATMMALAAKFGVSLDTISHALSGETYSHVPGALALSEFRRRGRPKGSSQRERRS